MDGLSLAVKHRSLARDPYAIQGKPAVAVEDNINGRRLVSDDIAPLLRAFGCTEESRISSPGISATDVETIWGVLRQSDTECLFDLVDYIFRMCSKEVRAEYRVASNPAIARFIFDCGGRNSLRAGLRAGRRIPGTPEVEELAGAGLTA